ncbi:MAG TPA: type II toxin-antitoxin system RelE/ParE family toxin [Pyrinomonadaceae bacterium]|nr:type II toxin-antitoxin system RelE/ParE family toxin [Pyrinomonadaceae bacterium]
MKVVFHPHAYDEMLESSRYLEVKNSGLGLDLLDAIQEAVRRITKFPESGSLERANMRKALVRGFPFTLLYEVRQDHLFIAAVMHQHRKPGYWASRM